MSNCKYTEVVAPNTCLGDSLATFNNNFSNLDSALCLQPTVFSGNGIRLNQHYTEQNINSVTISTTPAVVHGEGFNDVINGATPITIQLDDNTKIKATHFPFNPYSVTNPTGVFTAVALTDAPPRVTIFWTASGADYTTVYATNSATNDIQDMGTSGFNGSINAILSTGDLMYVAGSFTTAGGYEFRKLCVIDITKGPVPDFLDVVVDGNIIEGNLGPMGQVVEKPVVDPRSSIYIKHPLTDNGGFGLEGSVNVLLQYGDLLVVGGSYHNVPGKNLGRGLTIWNSRTNRVYPFYVNGEVNALYIQEDNLYIGGTFNFLNYGPRSVSDISGQRVYTNGLAKISLSLVDSFANKSIIRSFSENIILILERNATIYTIAVHEDGAIYIGGEFTSYSQGNVLASNLALLTPEGTISTTWGPVLNGPVYKMIIEKGTLYVAGAMSYYIASDNLEDSPRPYEPFYNLMCFNTAEAYHPAVVTSWKPITNGPVFDLAVHNGLDKSEFIYCYGRFDEINNVSVSFLGAVPKNAGQRNNLNEGQTPVNWKVYLNKPPQKNSNGLLRLNYSILLGGNFTQVNGHKRKYLANINGPGEEFGLSTEQYVTWRLGGQILGPGAPISLDFSQAITIHDTSIDYKKVNKSVFPLAYTQEVFKNYIQGTLLRFFVQREATTEVLALSSDAYIIGWKIEFGN